MKQLHDEKFHYSNTHPYPCPCPHTYTYRSIRHYYSSFFCTIPFLPSWSPSPLSFSSFPMSVSPPRKPRRSSKPKLSEADKQKTVEMNAEFLRLQRFEDQRWKFSLRTLRDVLPILRECPFSALLEPPTLHDFLDSLTFILHTLPKRKDTGDVESAESLLKVLSDVVEFLFEISRFSKSHPSFVISHSESLVRLVRLLAETAHPDTQERAITPHVINLIIPSIDREEGLNALSETPFIKILLSLWSEQIDKSKGHSPSPSLLMSIINIMERVSNHSKFKQILMKDDLSMKLMEGTIQYLGENSGGFPKDFSQQLGGIQNIWRENAEKERERGEKEREKDSLSVSINNSSSSSPSPSPFSSPLGVSSSSSLEERQKGGERPSSSKKSAMKGTAKSAMGMANANENEKE